MPISSTAPSSIANMARTYSQIAHTTLATTSSSVTFTGIPSTYTDLVLVVSSVQFVSTSGFMRFNNDTSANYHYRAILSSDATTQSLNQSTGCWISDGASQTSQITSVTNIMNYTSTSFWKSMITRFAGQDVTYTALVCSTWKSTSAINTINIYSGSGDYKIGSKFSLFGIKRA